MNIPVITPEDYLPFMNEYGVYVDKLPNKENCIRCGCGTKTLFTNNAKLKLHFKTKIHNEWLILLNLEKDNHLKEMQKYKSLSTSQSKIIQQQQETIFTNKTLIIQQQQKIASNESEILELRQKLYSIDID